MDSQTKSSLVADTIADLKGIPTREDLSNLLSESLVEVKFLKLDGDERTMTCTLVPTYLPESNRDDKLSQTKIRNLEEKVVGVWDINAQGWRSFRYDRIISVNPLSIATNQ
jgi:hypothetical protein